MPSLELATTRKLLGFGLVGAVGTAAHYLVLIVLVEAAGIRPVWATTIGFTVGAVINYLLNHRFTFQSSKNHLDAGPKFFFIALVTAFLNGGLVHLGVQILGLNYLLVQIVATLAVFLANFVLNSIWTFKESNPA
jgi:putative flippase GtrA